LIRVQPQIATNIWVEPHNISPMSLKRFTGKAYRKGGEIIQTTKHRCRWELTDSTL